MAIVTTAAGGNGGYTQSLAKENSELQKIELEITALLSDFTRMTNDLESICDRAFGMSPKSEQNAKVSPLPNGMLETLTQQIGYLREVKNQQYDLISRIQRIV